MKWVIAAMAAMAGAAGASGAVALFLLISLGLQGGFAAAVFVVVFGFLFAMGFALPHAFLLGLPLYALLGLRWRVTWWNAALCGFAIGAMPIAVGLYAPPSLMMTEAPVMLALMYGLAGAAGGIAFHWALRNLRDEPVEDDL